jgi:hypothetical protein
MKLSIVIPVYNEALTLAEILRRVREVPLDKELIVVDDGSTDGSRRLLERIAAPDLRVVLHDANRGKGAAIRTGFAHATGDAVVVQDADLEYSPQDLPRLFGLLERDEADVVYGSRFKGTHRSFLFSHYVGNQVLNFLTNLMFNSCLTDMETCYKMMKIDVLRQLDLESDGFDIEPEITAKVLRRGYRLVEVPITFVGRDYAEGKKIDWTDGVHALAALVKWRLRAPGRPVPLPALVAGAYEHHRWAATWLAPHLGRRVVHLYAGPEALAQYLLDRDSLVVTHPDPHAARQLAHRFRFVDHVTCEALDPEAPGQLARLGALAFDTLLLTGGLDAVEDDHRLLAALTPALRDGARLVLLVAAGDGRAGRFDRALGRVRTYDAPSLARLAAAAGLEVLAVEHHNRLGSLGLGVHDFLPLAVPSHGTAVAVYRALVPLARRMERGARPGRGRSLLLVARAARADPR